LPYLLDGAEQDAGALNLELDVLLLTPGLRQRGAAPHRVSSSNASHMYWTPAQMVAHHTSGGCDLRPGDLLGTGTISGPDVASCGSLLEATLGGRQPIVLPSGEQRRFLEDGDEVILRASAQRDGYAPIGFGECRAVILPAPALD
jgi:fumarylacetoacetase